MTQVTKEQLLGLVGDFTWFWGWDFFIVTSIGNFHWKNPNYQGDNTITSFNGDLEDFCKFMKMDYGRDKGFHEIERYCGDQFTLIVPAVSLNIAA